ncbi:MAG TPA: GGDEF domain-containing protein [Candidatus Binatia bacterium]|nr:GGDEF domain-containing protein [Candidatus Binatia bacterium]
MPNDPAPQFDFADASRQIHVAHRLVAAAQALARATQAATVHHHVCAAAREIAGAQGATFVIREGEQCRYAEEDAMTPLWKGTRLALDACVAGWAMQHRRPAIVGDVYRDARVPVDNCRTTFVRSLVTLPVGSPATAALGVYWARAGAADVQPLAPLQALADLAAATLDRVAQAEALAQRADDLASRLEQADRDVQRGALGDELTGLYNRHGFYLLAEQALKHAHRVGQPARALFIDVDGLRALNDCHGREQGDILLADVARAMKYTFRSSDVVGRIGGDEFAVLAITRGDADALQRRFTEKLAQLAARRPYPVSVSVGAASSADPQESLDALVGRAEDDMRAKHAARTAQQALAAASAARPAAGHPQA